MKPIFVGELQIGSIVEFPRGTHSHAGVYVGCGRYLRDEFPEKTNTLNIEWDIHYIVHFQGNAITSGNSWKGKSSTKIRIDNIESHLASDGKRMMAIDIHSCGPPFSPRDIVRRCLDQLGSDFGGYDLQNNNCQHFAPVTPITATVFLTES